MFIYSLLGVLFVLPINCQVNSDIRPTVRLPQGQIVGTTIYGEHGKKVKAYFGIPYAEPPIGKLRFAPPQKHKGWNTTFYATEYKKHCPQLPLKEGQTDNEDCLYLNVWTSDQIDTYRPVPVVIVLEGIEFSRTNRVAISGEDMANEGVIVVTINYRLNVFGFLCLGTPELRGNLGLIDQYYGMVWVKDNIGYFGGNSNKITLFGYSSGAASIVYHMISPRTTGLFEKVILSSGSIFSPWHLSHNQFKASEDIIKKLGCTDIYSSNVLYCLKSKSTADILKAYEDYNESENFPDLFLPVIDSFLPQNEQYLPMEPKEVFKKGNFSQVPIVIGISKSIVDPQFGQWIDLASQGFSYLQQFFEQSKIPEILKRYQLNDHNPEHIIELLKWRYIDTTRGEVRHLIEKIKTIEFEVKVLAPHNLQLNAMMPTYRSPIYVYNINDVGFVINTSGSTLVSDVLLLFGPSLINKLGSRLTSTDKRLSTYIKQLFINFIIYGNPTPNNNMKQWKEYLATEWYIETFDIYASKPISDMELYKQSSFWTNLIPKLANISHSNANTKEMHTNTDPTGAFRHAMYILVSLVIALLGLLLICVILIKKLNKQNQNHQNMIY